MTIKQRKWLSQAVGLLTGVLLLFAILMTQGAGTIERGRNLKVLADGIQFRQNTASNDTTQAYSLDGAGFVDISSCYANSSSSTMTIYVLGKIGSKWKLVYTGIPRTNSSIFTETLRNTDTNRLGAVEQVRVAFRLQGASDSTGIMKYYSNLLLR